ncbi:unnamed protein product [Nippostrongylus brasiliensis]|uniref:Uncharacterized protein n=1 Tax=Nippostrongylus brasiliensis TaxID=27835 RepID=A0A0N4XTT7_NIPBR|nr:unnamed protein product [Nippostrongylus brasiliensis]
MALIGVHEMLWVSHQQFLGDKGSNRIAKRVRRRDRRPPGEQQRRVFILREHENDAINDEANEASEMEMPQMEGVEQLGDSKVVRAWKKPITER